MFKETRLKQIQESLLTVQKEISGDNIENLPQEKVATDFKTFIMPNLQGEKNIIDLIDFEYSESELTNSSYYHNCDGIGKTKAYQLGLIYPQEIAASISNLTFPTYPRETPNSLATARASRPLITCSR